MPCEESHLLPVGEAALVESRSRTKLKKCLDALLQGGAWSDWQPLEGCWLAKRLPDLPGLYRIRLVEEEREARLAYIGRTHDLRERARALRGVYDDEKMPYTAPHVAAPCLWAWRKSTPHAHFEISVALLDGVSPPLRLGLEAFAIALYRQEKGSSPFALFGRMKKGYRSSSSNDARLIRQGKRYRGGPSDQEDESHLPGIAPMGTLGGDPHALVWGGHHWSPWSPVSKAGAANASGLYRLRENKQELCLIGYGQLHERLKSYKKPGLTCSWVAGPWHLHELLELQTDLIAAYLLACVAVPPAQFDKQARQVLKQVEPPSTTLFKLVCSSLHTPLAHLSEIAPHSHFLDLAVAS